MSSPLPPPDPAPVSGGSAGLRGGVARIRRFGETLWGRRISWVLRGAGLVLVIGWLAVQLADIGWAEVWTARPRTPWFYLLWIVLYLQLPLVESLIYWGLWGLPVREGLPPIIRKRALNQNVVSYSGEAYFFAWVRRHLGLGKRRIAGTLKDNAIASGMGSWTAAVVLISVFLMTGQIVLVDLLGPEVPLYAAVAAVALVGIGVRFRRTLFSLPPRTVATLFAVHLGRFLLLVYVLQILQWWVVLPEAPLSVWATMLAALTLINRIPLLPAADLVGIGAVLGMSDLLAASEATIAAMLLTRSALDKGANVLLFLVSYLTRPREPLPALEAEETLPDPAEPSSTPDGA